MSLAERYAAVPQRPRFLLRVVALFWLTRVLHLGAVWVWASRRHESVLGVLTKADGLHYTSIAVHGYAPLGALDPSGVPVHTSDLVFFPLYPLLVRLPALVLDVRLAAVLVTLLAGTVASVLIALWAEPQAGQRAAAWLVLLWATLPSAAVLDMGYSEALFVALAAGTLLALARRRWIAAALACALAGLSRPTGVALVASLVVAVLLDGRLSLRKVAAVLIAPLGLLVALTHVALATGRWDGWFWLEGTVWRSGFDLGRSTWSRLADVVQGGPSSRVAPYVVAAATVVLFVALLVAYLLRRPRPADAVFAVLAMAMTLGGAGYFHSKPRFLLTVFPVLLAPSAWLSRLPRTAAWVVGAVLLVVSTGWNAWLLVGWRYSL